MVDVITSIDIAAPLQEVTDYAMDQDNAPEWYSNINSVEWRTQRPMSLGTKFAFVARFLGRELRYVYEIIELSGTVLVMKTADGPFPMETTYRFEKIDSKTTRMTLRNRGEPSGFSRLLSPFMAVMMKKENKRDLASIKRIIERKRTA